MKRIIICSVIAFLMLASFAYYSDNFYRQEIMFLKHQVSVVRAQLYERYVREFDMYDQKVERPKEV